MLILYSYYINKIFKLKSYLLAIKNLLNKYLRVYIYKILIKTLNNYNIIILKDKLFEIISLIFF